MQRKDDRSEKEKNAGMVPAMVLYTLRHLSHYLFDHDPELARAFADHIDKFVHWVVDQDFTRPPE